MAQRFHRHWFTTAAVVVGSFGPLLFLAASGVAEPARLVLDFLSWPIDGNISYLDPTVGFLSALTGGFLLGWAVTIWCIGRYLYPVAPEAARKTVVYGLVAWFLLDSAGSVLSGHSSNALFNIIVLMIAVGPLWKPVPANQ